MGIIRFCISLTLMLFCVQLSCAQKHRITETFQQRVFFREAHRYIDLSYHDNGNALNNIKSAIEEAQQRGTLSSVKIQAWASPSGNAESNLRLALNRTNELAAWIIANCNIDTGKVEKISGGVGWDVLLGQLAASDLAYRQEVIEIIETTPVWIHDSKGRLVGSRKKILMELDHGRIWRDMEKRFFPYIRSSLAVVMETNEEEPLDGTTIKAVTGKPLPAAATDSVDMAETVTPSDTTATEAEAEITDSVLPMEDNSGARTCPFALKTNLLFDILAAPNVEVEVPIGKRWSVMGEWWFPWWVSKDDDWCYQLLYGGVEGRYWLGNRSRRDVMTGHFLGVFAGGGKYDFEWDDAGYQGEFYIAAGISYGYAHKIAKHLRLEYNIGIGFLQTEYRHYHGEEDNKYLVWQSNGRYTWLGPTKAKVSLVWMLPIGKRKGGAR